MDRNENVEVERRPGRGMTLPVILIAAGLLLFATNYGLLGWDFLLGIAQYWPVFLVAAGVDMLLRGRYRASVYGGAVVVAIALYAAGGALGIGGSATTLDVAQGLEGARRAEVVLDSSIADLNLTGSSTGQLLASGTLTSQRGEEIRRTFEVQGDTAQLTLRTRSRVTLPINVGRGGSWDLELTGRVPLALTVDTGVGRSNLDLRALDLVSLDLDSGVGDVTLTLPAAGAFAVDVDGGVGDITVRLPRSLEARVTVDSGLGDVEMPSGFSRTGDVYTSAGFDGATDRVEIDIDGGVGSIRFEQIDRP